MPATSRNLEQRLRHLGEHRTHLAAALDLLVDSHLATGNVEEGGAAARRLPDIASSMDSAQARQILDRRLYAVLGTENDDRSPALFLLDNGRILIATPGKARNVAARPHGAVLVQTPDAAWAFGSGPATIVPGTDANGLNERIRAKYLTDHGHRACGDLLPEMDD
ncbi:hypothetical protein ACWEK5_49750, partial [Rhodococcus koreensis]